MANRNACRAIDLAEYREAAEREELYERLDRMEREQQRFHRGAGLFAMAAIVVLAVNALYLIG